METVQDLNLEQNEEMMKRIEKGQFSLKDLYEQFQQIMQLGPLSKIVSMMPGMSSDMFPPGAEENTQKYFKQMLCIMDSMTEEELEGDGKIFVSQPTRVLRIARGSGSYPEDIGNLLFTYKNVCFCFVF